MRISDLTRAIVPVVLAACAVPLAAPAWADRPAARAIISFRSADAAFDQGIGAYKAGKVELAIPALESASKDPKVGFVANFYLARILSDNAHAMTDHGRAYDIYFDIVDEFSDVDPEENRKAPFVAKALVALAHYTKNGVPGRDLKSNPHRAAHFIHQAATVFSDEDAQFELAKLFLTGDGIEPDVRRAVHWFSVLSQRGHWGAQAYLADIYWRDKHVERNQRRALALITLALENAPLSERIWMEDIHQDIYCGTTEGMRSEVTGVVADWRQKYKSSVATRSNPDGVVARAPRICSDGRSVPYVARQSKEPTSEIHPTGSSLVPAGAAPAAPSLLGVGQRSR